MGKTPDIPSHNNVSKDGIRILKVKPEVSDVIKGTGDFMAIHLDNMIL